MNKPDYICPLCRENLTLQDKTLRCLTNHCFDMAKEGYVNLLPVHHKHSKEPGDNKTMVNARRAFLEKGYYQPLMDKLLALYQKFGDQQLPVLDAGCGEGYYTNHYKVDSNAVYGVDIAKNAVRIAAKKYNKCHFSVGTLSHLPFNENTFGWINSIYAPIIEKEFTRVLSSKGYVITVTPNVNHLIELKALIYKDAHQHAVDKIPLESLTLVAEESLNYVMDFDNGEDTVNLLAMTPFAFKGPSDIQATLRAKQHFSCQADFLIRLYQKT